MAIYIRDVRVLLPVKQNWIKYFQVSILHSRARVCMYPSKGHIHPSIPHDIQRPTGNNSTYTRSGV